MTARTRHVYWVAFGLLVLLYMALYCPYGINESDGGFLTGLAWQWLCGKTLYGDIVYVRTPLPIWFRAAELTLLPEEWAILGERVLFYLKVATYSALGTLLLLPKRPHGGGVAMLAFMLSAHNYPPTAMHTIDGLLLGTLGFWVLFRFRSPLAGVTAGVLFAASMLCKQSFYPLAAVGIGIALWERSLRWSGWLALGMALGWGAFSTYLYAQGLWSNFWSMTAGATTWRQALQHGVFDYFYIRPETAALSAPLLAIAWWSERRGADRWALAAWLTWLLLLGAIFIRDTTARREFMLPFAQIRLLFWVSNAYALWQGWRGHWPRPLLVRYSALAALSWCAAVSWGYHLPILYSVPWAFAIWDISRYLQQRASIHLPASNAVAVVYLFALFYLAHQWVYRDGRRSDMNAHLGDVFPSLTGIYSTPQKAALYRNLAELAKRYGHNIAVIPTFTQASFLTRTPPPLPLDWIARREMGRFEAYVEAEAQRLRPVFLLEKTALTHLADPELALVRRWYEQGKTLEETPHFYVFRLP
jgi:hypothetical protein